MALDVSGQVKISGGSPGNGKMLTSNASGVATWSDPASKLYVATYQTAAGIDGEDGTAGSWTSYPLNTLTSFGGTDITLSSSVLTLQPGTYKVSGYINLTGIGLASVRARDTGNGLNLFINTRPHPLGSSNQTIAPVNGVFSISATTSVEVQYYAVGLSDNSLGFNNGQNTGEPNVWGSITFEKVK